MRFFKISNLILGTLIVAVLAICSVLLIMLSGPTNESKFNGVSPVESELPTEICITTYGTTDFSRNISSSLEDAGHTVSVLNYPMDSYYDIANVLLHSNDCPDIVFVDNPAAIGTMLPENQFVRIRDFYEFNTINGYESDSDECIDYIAPPLGTDSYVVYYNEELTDALGYTIDVPSLDEISEICASARTKGYHGIALSLRSFTGLKNVLVQLADDAQEDMMQSAADNFEKIRAYISPDAAMHDYDDAISSFAQGNSCFYFGTELERKHLERTCDFSIGQTLVSVHGEPIQWYDYYGMMALCKNAPNILEAFSLIKTLSNPNTEAEAQNITNRPDSNFISAKIIQKNNWLFRDGGIHIPEYNNSIKTIQNTITLQK